MIHWQILSSMHYCILYQSCSTLPDLVGKLFMEALQTGRIWSNKTLLTHIIKKLNSEK